LKLQYKNNGHYVNQTTVFCPCQLALVGPDHHSAKKVLILTMKLWKMKKSCDFYHEIMNLVEKNVGTPAILGRTPEAVVHINHLDNVSSDLPQDMFSGFRRRPA
jgi:hypothetical protein